MNKEKIEFIIRVQHNAGAFIPFSFTRNLSILFINLKNYPSNISGPLVLITDH